MEFLSLADAIKAARVSEKTLRRWIKSGRLAAELIEGPKGKEYRINAEDLDQALKGTPKKAVSEPKPATQDTKLDTEDLAALKALAEAQMAMIEELRHEVQQLRPLANEVRNLADQNHDLTAQLSQLQDRVIKALPAPMAKPSLWEKLATWAKIKKN